MKEKDKKAKASASAEAETIKRQHLDKELLVGLFVVLIFMAGIWLFLVVAHGSLAKAYAGSIPIKANMDEKQLQQQIDSATSSYHLTLNYQDGSQKDFSLKDIGVTIDTSASAKWAKVTLNESPVQRLRWWKPINLPLTTKTDSAAFQAFMTSQATEVKSVAKDATLTVKDGLVVVTPEVPGSGNGIKGGVGTVLRQVSHLNSQPLNIVPVDLPPQITSKGLEPSKAKVENIIKQEVTLTMAGKTITAKPADVANWLDLSPVPSAKTVDVTVNSGKVAQYIDQVAKPYVQPPRSKLITHLADGSEVVLDQGTNGIDVVDKDKTAANIAQKLLDGKGVKTDLSAQYATAQSVEVEPYDKWLVADVTTKRMYAYEKTNLVKTFLVSAGAPKTPTVIGKYAIYAKYVSQDMHGLNADGSRYFQPAVPYVNYFYKDYAVHGNYWRPLSWFGNINSSHGCVGITNGDAAWVYDWAPIGTPVIVHK